MVLSLLLPMPRVLAIALRAFLILCSISHCTGYVFVPDNVETVIDVDNPPQLS